MKRIAIWMAVALCLASTASAVETSERISDREIIESLVELKAGQKALNQRIDDMNGRFSDVDKRFDAIDKRFDAIDKRFDAVDKRIDDLRDEMRDQIGYIRTFMLWGFGILFGGMGILITVVIWDRRTALTPVMRRSKDLEERGDKLERVLKEFAVTEPRLAEILRTYSLM